MSFNVHISDMSWMQVEARVQEDDRAILPLGSVEQHAFLSLATDVILAERLGEARAVGFTSVNFDLIYGLPGQTKESWTRTLELISRMSPDRLAIYGFAFLPDQRPNQRSLKKWARPEGAEKLALLAQAHERLCPHSQPKP